MEINPRELASTLLLMIMFECKISVRECQANMTENKAAFPFVRIFYPTDFVRTCF